MAQRTIHYVFGKLIAEELSLEKQERFLLGSIMPDAIEGPDRVQSHFKVRTEFHTCFDFEAFRARFLNKMLSDDLYMGYYMHLVEDAFYRVYFRQYGFPMPSAPEEVKQLHNDYHILNSYVVEKYGIHNILNVDLISPDEPIRSIAKFRIPQFLDEMAGDFTEQTTGKTVFLTEAMVDQFIEMFAPLAVEEVKRLKSGLPGLQVKNYLWTRK